MDTDRDKLSSAPAGGEHIDSGVSAERLLHEQDQARFKERHLPGRH
jgi:hypothetical protein